MLCHYGRQTTTDSLERKPESNTIGLDARFGGHDIGIVFKLSLYHPLGVFTSQNENRIFYANKIARMWYPLKTVFHDALAQHTYPRLRSC